MIRAIRVMVEAKPAIARAGLEAVVHGDDRFVLVGEGLRDGDLLHSIRKHAPELLLLDAPAVPASLRGPQQTRYWLAGVEPILHQPGGPATVLLIANPVRVEVRRALQAGVRAILLRDATPREILGALESAAAGLAVVSPEVARLGISEHTVKFHVSSVLAKLGASTRTEAVSRGYREGLVVI